MDSLLLIGCSTAKLLYRSNEDYKDGKPIKQEVHVLNLVHLNIEVEQNGRHFPGDIFKYIFLKEIV